MRYFFLLLLCFLLLSQSSWADLVATAEKYVGVREERPNGGYWVSRFLSSVGLREGNPWCAAFVRYCLDEAKYTEPKVRSGLALDYVAKKSIPAKWVAKGYRKVSRNWLVIWKRGDTRKGHIGIVRKWEKNTGKTIEGNTGGKFDWEGDGVYEKERKIISAWSFRIVYFTETKK